MSVSMTESQLPDPIAQPEFYAGIPTKRALAWCVDIMLVGAMTAVVATLPLFIGWFFFPAIFLVISFAYRVTTLTSRSATIGMRIMNIELRGRDGARLDSSEAVLHTLGFLVASAFFFPQVVSIVLMLIGERKQGLHDILCGTAAINVPSRY